MRNWEIHSVGSLEVVLADTDYYHTPANPSEFLVINLRLRGWRDPAKSDPASNAYIAMGQQARDQFYTVKARVIYGHLEVSGSEQPELRIKLPE